MFTDSEDETRTSSDDDNLPSDSSLIGLSKRQRALINRGGNTLRGDVVGLEPLSLDNLRFRNHSSAKTCHTKACNKIRRYIASGASKSDLLELRKQLKLLALELLYHHEKWYKGYKDKSPDEREPLLNWLNEIDNSHLELTADVQTYLERFDSTLTQEDQETLQAKQ